jgi:hypothetical protein
MDNPSGLVIALSILVIIGAAVYVAFFRLPMKDVDPFDRAVDIYNAALFLTPSNKQYLDDKLIVNRNVDIVKIILRDKNSTVVFEAGDSMSVRDVYRGQYSIPTNINTHRPGQWVDYLLDTAVPTVKKQRQEEVRRKRREANPPVDDRDLF